MLRILAGILIFSGVFVLPHSLFGDSTVIDSKLHHLRSGTGREWSDFPVKAEGASFKVPFSSKVNSTEWALRLRQQDVKQTWKVILNGKDLGRLVQDENDMVIMLPVPAGRMLDGENLLVVEGTGTDSDDIRVGEFTLIDRPVKSVLNEARVDLSVRQVFAGKPPGLIPCRITVLHPSGALATMGSVSTNQIAVRPGVLYTGNGKATLNLPTGDYTIIAGRGFAYDTKAIQISLEQGETIQREFDLRRVVETPGYVACDTHIHSLTHSGHGDATDVERAITVAGEGIDLLIGTDHNLQMDYQAAAKRAGVSSWFTTVVGNEVTTSVGHFNVFPLTAGGPVPDFRSKDWKGVSAALGQTPLSRAVILNHARDLHSRFRPFGPERHISFTGENLDGWQLPANAMEVVNSGAQQSDIMRLVRDWFGMLNRGIFLTPVGSSDSHDVSRYIVGQGRTYIRSRSENPGEIVIHDAVENFVAGRVMVSCGLLAEIAVNGKHGSGDLVPAKGDLDVAVKVLGPGWVKADRVQLFANGIQIRETKIEDPGKEGVKWSGRWTLPKPHHDVHLVAVATGPGVEGLFWAIAKPYQPTSPAVNKRVMGLTGAVWIDGDGDGKRTSAFEYAKEIVAMAGLDGPKVFSLLANFDEAIAAQAAGILRAANISIAGNEVRAVAKTAGEKTLKGLETYLEEWRDSQMAQAATKK